MKRLTGCQSVVSGLSGKCHAVPRCGSAEVTRDTDQVPGGTRLFLSLALGPCHFSAASKRRRVSSTSFGFAFPFAAFITGPLNALIALSLPDLNSAKAFGLAAIAL